ncbi:hypothetical protein BH10PAT1_BH10PAT1_3860 [soil metagenome]
MINTEELLYVVDEFDVPQKPMPRKHVFKNRLWRRTAHVWVINSKKQILVQKRSLLKDFRPGSWEPSVAGHIGPDDNYFSGAARELFEETGISVAPSDLNLVKIYKDQNLREYRGIFYYKWDGEIQEIKSEEAEVDQVKFISISTLKKYLLYDKSGKWFNSGYEKEMITLLKGLAN